MSEEKKPKSKTPATNKAETSSKKKVSSEASEGSSRAKPKKSSSATAEAIRAEVARAERLIIKHAFEKNEELYNEFKATEDSILPTIRRLIKDL